MRLGPAHVKILERMAKGEEVWTLAGPQSAIMAAQHSIISR